VTRKERTKLSLNHKSSDIVPYNITFTLPAADKLKAHFNNPEFEEAIGNHLFNVDALNGDKIVKPGFRQDDFGVIWNQTVDKDIGVVEDLILKEPSLKGFKLPDPKAAWRYENFGKALEKHKDRFLLSDIGFSLFERAWTLRGMENLLIDMYENPGFVNDLLDAITEFNLAIIDESAKYPIDGMRFGDDWGQQSGLIMGPELWRKFIKPRIRKMYSRVRAHGLKVFIHSCGDVEEIFPDLIECGLDCFNPFQPEAYDIFKIKELHGSKLSFYGGMSTQKILPFGTADDVKKETIRLLKGIGSNGGYIFSPAHATPADVPLDNMLAMLEIVRNQEKYL